LVDTFSDYTFITVPPSFTTPPSTVSVEREADIELPCAARGDPDPTISWFRYGDELSDLDDSDKYTRK